MKGLTTEGLRASGNGNDKFGNNESKYYISSYNNSATDLRKGYTEDGSTFVWWLRSPYYDYSDYAHRVHYDGVAAWSSRVDDGYRGIVPALCLDN